MIVRLHNQEHLKSCTLFALNSKKLIKVNLMGISLAWGKAKSFASDWLENWIECTKGNSYFYG